MARNMQYTSNKDWCDDERDPRCYIEYYSEGYNRNGFGIYDVLKDIAKDDYTRMQNMHWNEIEYRDYNFEYRTLPYEPLDVDIDTDIDEPLEGQDENDEDEAIYNEINMFEGLVKNNFMYT